MNHDQPKPLAPEFVKLGFKRESKPTGEWTVQFVSEIANKSGFQELVTLHNAALRNAQPFLDSALKQLAAEMERADKAAARAELAQIDLSLLKDDLSLLQDDYKNLREDVKRLRERLAAAHKQYEELAVASVEQGKQLAAEFTRGYESTVGWKIAEERLEEIRQLEDQLAAATARELHSYDVAKQCRDELAAAYKQGYNDCDCELNGKPIPKPATTQGCGTATSETGVTFSSDA